MEDSNIRVIVAGSRDGIWPFNVRIAIHRSGYHINEVVSGGARGVDLYGEWWAEEHSIPVKRFPADWDRHGKGAGYIRNEQMAAYADALVAVWDGQSKGTAHMIKTMEALGKPVFVYKTSEQ
jgi:hypothetical protein